MVEGSLLPLYIERGVDRFIVKANVRWHFGALC